MGFVSVLMMDFAFDSSRRIEYFDDMASSESCPAQNTSDDRKAVYEAAAIACRNLHLTGIKIFCDELKADTSSPQRPQTTGNFPDNTMVVFILFQRNHRVFRSCKCM